MSVAAADIYKAVVAVWAAAGLDSQFKSYWPAADRVEFPALCEAEAEGSHPFPYCVFSLMGGKTKTKMSGAGGTASNKHNEIRDIPLRFKIHAKSTTVLSGKAIAAALADEVLKVFGGHPTVSPAFDNYALDNGHILISQYQLDQGMRDEDIEVYVWLIHYNLKSDVPVMV